MESTSYNLQIIIALDNINIIRIVNDVILNIPNRIGTENIINICGVLHTDSLLFPPLAIGRLGSYCFTLMLLTMAMAIV